MTKKKVMVTIPDLRGGGAERVFVNLINNLPRDRYDVKLAVGKLDGEYVNLLRKDIDVHILGATGVADALWPMFKAVKLLKPDVVVSTLGFVVVASVISIFCSNKIKFISRFGNTLSSFLNEIKSKSKWLFFVQYCANKIVVMLSHNVIVQSEHMRLDTIDSLSIKRRYYERIVVINNIIDFDGLYKTSLKNIQIPFDENDNVIFVSVGRLEQQKNYGSLIEAFHVIHSAHKNTRLIILGEGSLRSKMEFLVVQKKLTEVVWMPGFIDYPASVISKCNYYISTSHYEGVSNAMLESLALGVPVIATDCPSGVREVIVNGLNGWLYAVGDDLAADLYRIATEIIQNKTDINVNEIKRDIRSRYSIEMVIRSYAELFES